MRTVILLLCVQYVNFPEWLTDDEVKPPPVDPYAQS